MEKNKGRKDLNNELALCTCLDEVMDILEREENKNESNGKMYSEFTGLAIRKAMMMQELDYIYEKHTSNQVKDNAGTRMEYLVGRDVYEDEEHYTDNKRGSDIKSNGWDKEVKMISVSSPSSGYETMALWHQILAPKRKLLIVVVDRRVYRIYKKHTTDFLNSASFKEDYDKRTKKTEWRLRLNSQTKNAILKYGVFVDTVALY
jgi:hypothetical protein